MVALSAIHHDSLTHLVDTRRVTISLRINADRTMPVKYCYFNQGKVKGEVSDKVRSRDSRARGVKGSGVRLQKLRHRICSGEI